MSTPQFPPTVPVRLLPLVWSALQAAGKRGMSLSMIRQALLTAGVSVDTGELTSVLRKLLDKGPVTRMQVERGRGCGPSQVWWYRWVEEEVSNA
jgi:hypothetical protein